MTLQEIKEKYCVDAGLDFKSRPYQIFVGGESKPFFSTEDESRFNSQLNHLIELSKKGGGKPFKAYKNGKLVKEIKESQVFSGNVKRFMRKNLQKNRTEFGG